MAEEPLYGFSIGTVAQFPRQLEDAGGAERRHPHAAAASVNLGVAVFSGGGGAERLLPRKCECGGGVGSGGFVGGGGGGGVLRKQLHI